MALGRTNNRGTSRGGSTYGGSGPATAIQWSSVAHICASYGALVASGRTNNRGTSWGDSSFGGSGPTTAVQWSTSITFTPTRPHVGVAAPGATLFPPQYSRGPLWIVIRAGPPEPRFRGEWPPLPFGYGGSFYPPGPCQRSVPRGRVAGAPSPGPCPFFFLITKSKCLLSAGPLRAGRARAVWILRTADLDS